MLNLHFIECGAEQDVHLASIVNKLVVQPILSYNWSHNQHATTGTMHTSYVVL